jgi:hypothetical protein
MRCSIHAVFGVIDMNKKRIVLSSLAAFGLVALSLQPANAQNFLDYLRGVVRSEGGIAGNYGRIQSNFGMALNNSNARINSGVATGRINPFEARQLQNELANLEAMTQSMGADGLFTTAEVNTGIASIAALDSRINSMAFSGNDVMTNYYDGDLGYDIGYGYDMPYFDNYNSVYAYQQAMLNQLNAARISQAQRNAWRNQYNALTRQLTRDNLRNLNRANSRNNAQLRQLVRLNNQIRNANRVAQSNRFDNRRDNNRRDFNNRNNRRDNDRNDRRDRRWN